MRVNGLLSPFIELGVGFNPELTARDNIRINGTLLGLTRRAARRALRRDPRVRRARALRRPEAEELTRPGCSVRLAYSIAIQVPFDILLLDEVLAVGDQEFQEKCFDTLRADARRGQDDRVRLTRSGC